VDDDLPRVTLTHLRRAETMCPRRLAREHAGLKGMYSASPGFAVGNRLTEDARVAHTELRAARPSDFPTPTDLVPEQQRVYRAAAAGYLALFADRPVRAVEIDPWETTLDGEVRLVTSLGLALRRGDGTPELRLLRIGVAGRRALIDDAERRSIALRAAPWVAERPLVVFVADLLAGEVVAEELDVAGALPEARAWLDARIALIRERADDGNPRVGADCRACAFVPGCTAHTP